MAFTSLCESHTPREVVAIPNAYFGAVVPAMLAPEWARLGFERMRIGVGVHSGPAVVGTIGSPGPLDDKANPGGGHRPAERLGRGRQRGEGYLRLDEATDLGLDTGRVVLSAFQTGQGKL